MKFKILTLLLSSALLMAACGDDDKAEDKVSTEDTTTETQTTDDTSDDDDATDTADETFKLSDVKTSPEDAVKTAQKEANGDLESISLENSMGKLVYEVTLQDNDTQNEVKIDDSTNKVTHTENETDAEQDQTFKYSDAVSIDEALKAAQKEAKGELKEWSLDSDNNRLQYAFDLVDNNQSTEVELDAKTKEVIKVEKD